MEDRSQLDGPTHQGSPSLGGPNILIQVFSSVRYHWGVWSEEVNSRILFRSYYMVYL